MVTVNDLTLDELIQIQPINLNDEIGRDVSRRVIAETVDGTTLSFDLGSGLDILVVNPSGVNEVVSAGRWTISRNGKENADESNIIWFAGVDPYSYSPNSPSDVPLPNSALAVSNWDSFTSAGSTGPVEDYQSDVAEQFGEDIEDVPPPTESDAQKQKRLDEERRARQQADYERRQREAEERAEEERQLQNQETEWAVDEFTQIEILPPSEEKGAFSYRGIYMFGTGSFEGIVQVSICSREKYQPVARELQTEYALFVGTASNPLQNIVTRNFERSFVVAEYQEVVDEINNIESDRQQRENQTNVEVEYIWRFKEMPITIQEAFLENLDILKDRSWSGTNNPESIIFRQQGEVVELVDFDRPFERSAYFKYRVNPGVRIEVIFETESLTRFLAIDDTKPEGVTREARQFVFTQYGGDKLEIDIDNEGDFSRPFLIQVRGKNWYSATEFDDEVFLKFNKVEVMEWKAITKTQVLNYEGQVISEETEEDFDWKRYDTATEEAKAAIPNDAEFRAAQVEDAPIGAGAPVVDAEVDLDDKVEEVGEDIKDAFSINWKLILIGGAVLIGGFFLLKAFVFKKSAETVTETVRERIPRNRNGKRKLGGTRNAD